VNAPILAAVALADHVQSVGSYFGFAAVIGLGVLSLLYFAQAREVKRLREWAGRSPERDAELAQRVQADAQRRVTQPAGAPRPGPQPGSPQTAAAQQADAARKAAAAAVMEKFQTSAPGSAPVVGPPGQLDRPATATPGESATATPAPGSVAAASDTPAPPASGDASTTTVPPDSTAPSAAAAGAAAAAARQAGPPARAPAFANGAGGQDTHESAAARPAPLPDLPVRPRATPVSPSRHDEEQDSSGPRIGLIVGACAGVVAVVVVLVLLLTGGSDPPPASNEIGGSPPPPAAAKATSSTKVNRKATQIAVLNGTTQTGLARNVGNKLESSGFTILSVGDNADQQISTTTISYAAGSDKAAKVVAQIMGAPSSAVQPIDTNTATAVSPAAKIVVIVGKDRSNTG
jgi:hypothetical protein